MSYRGWRSLRLRLRGGWWPLWIMDGHWNVLHRRLGPSSSRRWSKIYPASLYNGYR